MKIVCIVCWRATDIGQCSVFAAIQSNIQVTIRSKDGTFITQVRRVHRTGFNYDRLDYLNNLSRYICRNQPSVAEIQEKYDEVMSRKKQPAYIEYTLAMARCWIWRVFWM